MKRMVILATLALTISATAALAEDIWVRTEKVDIRAGKGAIFPLVATASKGAQLTVVAREGKWLKVKAGTSEGYVYESAVSPEKVSGGGNILAGLSNSAAVSSGLATKGLDEDAENYAKGRSMNTRAMNWLVDFSKNRIPPAEWQQFVAEGKVGPEAGK